MTPTLNGLPSAWSALARSARAKGTALGAPAGVNPLKAMVSPSLMSEAASAAVSLGNGLDINIKKPARRDGPAVPRVSVSLIETLCELVRRESFLRGDLPVLFVREG